MLFIRPIKRDSGLVTDTVVYNRDPANDVVDFGVEVCGQEKRLGIMRNDRRFGSGVFDSPHDRQLVSMSGGGF